MFNQIFLESQKKVKKLEVPNNHNSALIKSFLKESNQFKNTEKKVISSNS
jgi:hypothetical protein